MVPTCASLRSLASRPLHAPQFSAVRAGLQPADFWGLRRPALQAGGDREPAGRRGILLGGGASSDEEGDVAWSGAEGSEGSELDDAELPSSSEEGGGPSPRGSQGMQSGGSGGGSEGAPPG